MYLFIFFFFFLDQTVEALYTKTYESRNGDILNIHSLKAAYVHIVFFLDLGELNLSQADLYCQGGWRSLKLPSQLWVPGDTQHRWESKTDFLWEQCWRWDLAGERAALSNTPVFTFCFPPESLASESLVTNLCFRSDYMIQFRGIIPSKVFLILPHRQHQSKRLIFHQM